MSKRCLCALGKEIVVRLIFAVMLAITVLSGCDNTLYGIGKDMQKTGADLSDRSSAEPPEPYYPRQGYAAPDQYAPRPRYDVDQPSR
jgi:predicted small secreted protein